LSRTPSENTIFSHYKAKTQVNLEVDVISRYLERLISGKIEENPNISEKNSALSLDILRETVF
jgi:riboflavin synthase alpha subunit